MYDAAASHPGTEQETLACNTSMVVKKARPGVQPPGFNPGFTKVIFTCLYLCGYIMNDDSI